MNRILGRLLMVSVLILTANIAVAKAIPSGDLLEGVKPGPDGKIDVLTVFPHADDEMYCDGTLLKMKQDPAVRIHFLVMTLGDLSPSKDVLGISPEKMAAIRVKEMGKVAAVVGADSYLQWELHDQGLPALPPEELASKILKVINDTHAEVIIGYGPEGIYGHPDHIAGCRAAELAFRSSPAQKLYYVNVPKALYPVYRLLSKTNPLPATVKVDVRKFKKMKMLAIDEETSQKYFMSWIPKLEMSLNFNYEYFTLAAEKP